MQWIPSINELSATIHRRAVARGVLSVDGSIAHQRGDRRELIGYMAPLKHSPRPVIHSPSLQHHHHHCHPTLTFQISKATTTMPRLPLLPPAARPQRLSSLALSLTRTRAPPPSPPPSSSPTLPPHLAPPRRPARSSRGTPPIPSTQRHLLPRRPQRRRLRRRRTQTSTRACSAAHRPSSRATSTPKRARSAGPRTSRSDGVAAATGATTGASPTSESRHRHGLGMIGGCPLLLRLGVDSTAYLPADLRRLYNTCINTRHGCQNVQLDVIELWVFASSTRTPFPAATWGIQVHVHMTGFSILRRPCHRLATGLTFPPRSPSSAAPRLRASRRPCP